MSVLAVHVRLICVCEDAVPVRLVGADGGAVSGATPVTVTDADCVAEPPLLLAEHVRVYV